MNNLESRTFKDDNGGEHELIPSSVILSIPQAHEKALEEGKRLNFDFLNDRQVHWLLHLRWMDVAHRSCLGYILGFMIAPFALGAWYFWDSYAAPRSLQFQVLTGVGYVVLLAALTVVPLRAAIKAGADHSRRNMRTRARSYRRIVTAARRAGAEIPWKYPYYGMYLTSWKFFPDAPEMEMPEGDWEREISES